MRTLRLLAAAAALALAVITASAGPASAIAVTVGTGSGIGGQIVDIDVSVEIDGVCFAPGDLVIADQDGIVVIPRSVEDETLRLALAKVQGENTVRDAIRHGMKATAAFQKYGIL